MASIITFILHAFREPMLYIEPYRTIHTTVTCLNKVGQFMTVTFSLSYPENPCFCLTIGLIQCVRMFPLQIPHLKMEAATDSVL